MHETVGNYRIVGSLGVGGMGTVYRGEHLLIGRAVAVKLLNPEMTSNRDVVARFFNEARATSAIKHPGIVEIFDFGYTPAGHAFIVMELLEGEPLSQRIRARQTFSEGEAAILMRDVCSALAAAHAKGIVHRDLKPDNIFIVPDPELGERTKLLDFGIAKLTDIGLASSATKTGSVLGTPTYMSPEQCRGSGHVDHRADLYSIGCMLYELVAGRPPFTNPGAGELIGSHLFVDPQPLSQHAQVSPELDALVMTLLRKDPAQRIQSARELQQHLLAIAQASGIAVRMTAASMSTLERASSSAGIAVPTPSHLTPSNVPAHFTPAQSGPAQSGPVHFTPGHFTPAHFTPAHQVAQPTPSSSSSQRAPSQPAQTIPGGYTPAGPMTPTFTTSDKPTTLSGSASEASAVAPARRRIGVIVGAAVIALAAGIGGFVATRKHGGDEVKPAATSEDKPSDRSNIDKPSTATGVDKPTSAAGADKPSTATGVDNPTTGVDNPATTGTATTGTSTTGTSTTGTSTTGTSTTGTSTTGTSTTGTSTTGTSTTGTSTTGTSTTDKPSSTTDKPSSTTGTSTTGTSTTGTSTTGTSITGTSTTGTSTTGTSTTGTSTTGTSTTGTSTTGTSTTGKPSSTTGTSPSTTNTTDKSSTGTKPSTDKTTDKKPTDKKRPKPTDKKPKPAGDLLETDL